MKHVFIGLLLCSASGVSLIAKCKVNKITSVPCTITESGKYILCRDVTYTGSEAAICIEANNVELDLFAHTITLKNKDATGIKIGDLPDRICEITINNDAIINESIPFVDQTGTGILVKNACKVRLHNMFTINHKEGLRVEDSSDVIVERSNFSKANTNGVHIMGSEAVTFDESVFKKSKTNMLIDETSKGCKIFTSSFLDAVEKNLAGDEIDGLLVKNTSFTQNEDASTNDVVSLGTDGPTSANGIRFECSTFVAGETVGNLIGYNRGSNLIVDSCLFESNSVSALNGISLSGTSSNILVRDCTMFGVDDPAGISCAGQDTIIQGCIIQNWSDGIRVVPGSTGTTIRECTVCKNFGCGIVLNTSSSDVVTHCIVNENGRPGILETDTTSCVFRSNVIAKNGEDGITCEGGNNNTIVDNDVLGNGINGIELESDAKENSVQRNRVHTHTSGTGILDGAGAASDNKYYFNTAHNNTTNYSAISASTGPIVNPGDGACTGDPAGGLLEGANIEPV